MDYADMIEDMGESGLEADTLAQIGRKAAGVYESQSAWTGPEIALVVDTPHFIAFRTIHFRVVYAVPHYPVLTSTVKLLWDAYYQSQHDSFGRALYLRELLATDMSYSLADGPFTRWINSSATTVLRLSRFRIDSLETAETLAGYIRDTSATYIDMQHLDIAAGADLIFQAVTEAKHITGWTLPTPSTLTATNTLAAMLGAMSAMRGRLARLNIFRLDNSMLIQTLVTELPKVVSTLEYLYVAVPAWDATLARSYAETLSRVRVRSVVVLHGVLCAHPCILQAISGNIEIREVAICDLQPDTPGFAESLAGFVRDSSARRVTLHFKEPFNIEPGCLTESMFALKANRSVREFVVIHGTTNRYVVDPAVVSEVLSGHATLRRLWLDPITHYAQISPLQRRIQEYVQELENWCARAGMTVFAAYKTCPTKNGESRLGEPTENQKEITPLSRLPAHILRCVLNDYLGSSGAPSMQYGDLL